jgi:hypothetical protein
MKLPGIPSSFFTPVGEQTQTKTPSPDRKKRNPGSFPFENLISSYFPGMFISTGTGQGSSTTEKPIAY